MFDAVELGGDEKLRPATAAVGQRDGRATPIESRLRVMMISARAFPYMGGIETHVHEVAPRLAMAGVDVKVVTADPSVARPRLEHVDGVPIVRVPAWPSKPDYTVAPEIYRMINRSNCDLVHLQGCHTLLAPGVLLAAKWGSVPYVVSLHSGGHSSRIRTVVRRLQWPLLRPLLRRALTLIAVSDFEKEYFSLRLRLPQEQFSVVPNGCDLPVAQVGVMNNGPWPVIVSVGRLERYKGHQRAIAALPWLLPNVPNARLRILGSGPYEPQLRALARRLQVSEQVDIEAVAPGDRRGMAGVLSGASLVILLSEYEAQPISMLEAMGLGKPVLVADTSGLRELGRYGRARTIPLRSNPAAVAAAMFAELSRPAEASRPQLPSWDDCATGLLAVYREATVQTEAISDGARNG